MAYVVKTKHSSIKLPKKLYVYVVLFCLTFQLSVTSQNYEIQSLAYNSLIGAVTGGVGALFNKHEGEKWHKAVLKGMGVGSGGGLLMYAGKKANNLIAVKHEIGYAWLSRLIFSAGNSIVENAAANIPFYSRWHYDIGFIRMELNLGPAKFTPRIMPSNIGGFIFILSSDGIFKVKESLQSGTFVFGADKIEYANELTGSTPANGFVITNHLNDLQFHELFAHEMIHTFHFQEFSGINYFPKPIITKWRNKSKTYNTLCKWIYSDLNYEAMLINYFFIQGGYKENYTKNFLEIEAEYLSVGRAASK